MPRTAAGQKQLSRITLVVPRPVLDAFRAAAREETGVLPSDNPYGDASAPTVLRRLVVEYVELFGRGVRGQLRVCDVADGIVIDLPSPFPKTGDR